jgi:hypothetical protein
MCPSPPDLGWGVQQGWTPATRTVSSDSYHPLTPLRAYPFSGLMADRAGQVRVIPAPASPPPPQQGSRVGFVGRLVLTSVQAPPSSVSPPPVLTLFEKGCALVSHHCLRSPETTFSLCMSTAWPRGYTPYSPFDIMLAAWK